MALKDNLLSYWNMDQEPLLLYDLVQPTKGVKVVSGATSVTGKVGKAIQLSTGQQLGVDTGLSTESKPFTVAFWFKPFPVVGQMSVLGADEWFVDLRPSGAEYHLFVGFEEGVNTIEVLTPIKAGEWYFVALGWYNNNGTFLWASVNLSDRVRLERAAGLPHASDGIAWYAGNVFDETGIWRRNVSALELREIYNKGKGLAFSEWDKAIACKQIVCCE